VRQHARTRVCGGESGAGEGARAGDAAPHKMAGTDEALLPGVVIQAPEQGRRGCPPIDPATKRGYPSTHS
jgi:hypothetical protein